MNTQPIKIAQEYFDLDHYALTPIISWEFSPGKGWKRQTFRKHVSRSWLRKLAKEGVTHVGLSPDAKADRTADFSIAELLKQDRRPLLTGNLIGAAVKLS